MSTTGQRITTHDAAAFSDHDLALGAQLFNTLEVEIWPEDPVTPVETRIAHVRAMPSRVRRTEVRAWAPDGALVGSVELEIDPEDDDDPDVLHCWISVRSGHRRRRIGTALLRGVTEVARAEGRQRLIGRTFSRVPAGEAFAASTGATAKSTSHTNHLPVAEVDRALLEGWVTDGPRRAPGYELLVWEGPVPEEHLGDFVDLMLVMNDAPRDELQLNDFTLTPTRWRETEQRGAAVGEVRWIMVARRVDDGAFAGLHTVAWVPAYPEAMFIGSTGVRREHRGHALGKWLKAAMTLRILDQMPGVTDIRTDNADSNDAMLSINQQMGYRPMMGTTTWELRVDDAERWLASRDA